MIGGSLALVMSFVSRNVAWLALGLLVCVAQDVSALTLVGSTSAQTSGAGAGALAVPYPAGLGADDVLIAQIAIHGNRSITPPAGWTLINQSNNGSILTQAVYWKRVGASSPASDVWNFSVPDRAGGVMVAYRGVDPVAPVNVFSSSVNPGSTSVTAVSLTPGVSDTRLVGLYALGNGNAGFTPPAGMTEQQDFGLAAGPNGVTIELADEAYAGGTAATGNRVATATVSAASIAHLVALQSNVIAHYRMDEPAWTGTPGQVLDSAGRAYHATAGNGSTTSGTTPAVPGNPGTCNHGVFDGNNDYVALPAAFPNLTTDFTITAWIRTANNTKSGQRIFIDDQNNSGGYGFSLGDGGTGRVRFYTRAVTPIILDTPNVIQNNIWYFVAAVADIQAKATHVYVYNQAGTQLAHVTQAYAGTWGVDAGRASIGGENDASTESSSSFRFHGNLDEIGIHSGALSAARVQAVMNQTRPCSLAPPAVPGGFNAFETTTPAASVVGVIRTKVAASPFAVDVVALNSGGSAVQTAFTGGVRVELVDASAGVGCTAHAAIRNLGTLTFGAGDQGRKTIGGINEPEAWPNVRARMSYPASGVPTVVACSTDAFAIRPASFGNPSARDADSASAGSVRVLDNLAGSGGVVHRAGRPFTLRATAYNAAGAATALYAGAPLASFVACLLPASGCVPGALAAGTWSAVSGTLTSDTARYEDAGAFSMQLVDATFAAIDAGDGSSVAERQIESAVFSVGRFVPDHFDLAATSVPQFRTFNDATCAARSFTYVGQPFGYVTLPQVAVAAKNASGAATHNYTGALWKLAAGGVDQAYSAASGTLDTALLTPQVIDTGAGTGTVTPHADDLVAFARSVPVAPFAARIDLALAIRDTAENAVTGNGIIDTLAPALFDDIGFDAGNDIRFGRLKLTNAHGSELLALPVPIETQYWNGSGFARNAADQCTQLAATHVALSAWRRDLGACESSVSLSGRFAAGRGNLRLNAPGAGNTGSVDLTVRLDTAGGGSTCIGGSAVSVVGATQDWLQGAWTGAAYDQNPVARASFGLHRGSHRLIYIREMY